MNSALYEGLVRHRRFAPVPNEFHYRVCLCWIDLDELDEVFRGRLHWSAKRPALAWLRRADYLGDPRVPLKEAVLDLVGRRTGRRPEGPVRMLAHLRTLGYVFNPVTFYYCYDRAGTRVEAIVAEITNTPWNERHAYVLPRSEAKEGVADLRFSFDKDFHVSPFLPMDVRYHWRFLEPGRRLVVHMIDERNGERLLDATLALRRREITTGSLARALLLNPLMTFKVSAAIYLQALRLWWKGAPFHEHPKTRPPRGPEPPARGRRDSTSAGFARLVPFLPRGRNTEAP